MIFSPFIYFFNTQYCFCWMFHCLSVSILTESVWVCLVARGVFHYRAPQGRNPPLAFRREHLPSFLWVKNNNQTRVCASPLPCRICIRASVPDWRGALKKAAARVRGRLTETGLRGVTGLQTETTLTEAAGTTGGKPCQVTGYKRCRRQISQMPLRLSAQLCRLHVASGFSDSDQSVIFCILGLVIENIPFKMADFHGEYADTGSVRR